MYAFEPTEEQRMLIDSVQRFAANDLRAASHEADEQCQFPANLIKKGWELGLLQASIPESYGGFGEYSSVTGHLTDVTVHARGDHMLTGQGSATTWPLSMKQATERIEQQAQRVKEKWQSRKRRAPGRRGLEPATAPSAPADVAETLPRVVRVRHIARPMDVETAAARLDASGDPFILFRNDTSGRTAVLVRRKDGSLGLIEPGA